MSHNPFRITAAVALAPHGLRLTFEDGLMADIDLVAIIKRYRILKPLRDPAIFAKAAVGMHGTCVTWGSDELELTADNLRAEAVEQARGFSPERIIEWMDRHALTLDTGAAALGLSRRMLAYYCSGANRYPALFGWRA